MTTHWNKPKPNGYVQRDALAGASRDVSDAADLVNSVATPNLPAAVLTVLLKVMFLLLRAGLRINTARDIAGNEE